MLNLEPITQYESIKTLINDESTQKHINEQIFRLFAQSFAQYTVRDYARIITETQPLRPRFQNNPINWKQEGF